MSDLLEGGDMTVIEGRDDWLFLDTYGGGPVLEIYTEPEIFSEHHYRQWAETLRARREYCAARGIAYFTTIAPDPYPVYPDKLPPGVALAAATPFQRVWEHLGEEDRACSVHPLAALIAGRERTETYQSVDSHWTDWGSWLAYQETMQVLRRRFPELPVLTEADLEWGTGRTFGALGAFVTPERRATIPVASLLDPQAVKGEQLLSELREGLMVMERPGSELPTALIYRDSFMTSPAKYYQESFGRTIFVTSKGWIHHDLIERFRPDVVIHAMAERRLNAGIEEPSALDFRGTWGDLDLPDLAVRGWQLDARTALTAGDHNAALTANGQVLDALHFRQELPPARLLAFRARVLRELGRGAAATEALRHAVSLDPTDGGLWYFLAQQLWADGDQQAATQAAAHAVQLEPEQVSYWSLPIIFSLHVGDVARALALASEATRRHPRSGVLWGALGTSQLASGLLDDGISSFERAVTWSGQPQDYARQLGTALAQAKRWTEAVPWLELAVSVQPELADLGQLLAAAQAQSRA